LEPKPKPYGLPIKSRQLDPKTKPNKGYMWVLNLAWQGDLSLRRVGDLDS
jgi:hypothetical protein